MPDLSYDLDGDGIPDALDSDLDGDGADDLLGALGNHHVVADQADPFQRRHRHRHGGRHGGRPGGRHVLRDPPLTGVASQA